MVNDLRVYERAARRPNRWDGQRHAETRHRYFLGVKWS
jgi:hypothetical protein